MTDKARRPSSYGKDINLEIARALLPRVLLWLKLDEGAALTEEETSVILDELSDACACNDDGYGVARDLDNRHMWDVDSELVDILDAVAFERIKAHDRSVEAWVLREGVKPEHALGQRVQFRFQKWDKVSNVGEVIEVDERKAKYLVFCESLGHVRNGVGTHGVYVPFEETMSV